MLKIYKNNEIKLTRGDSMTLALELIKDGAEYTPAEGDSVRFALAKGYVSESDYELIKTITIPVSTLEFTLPSADTKELQYGKYNYDIQITHADGTVDTFISSTLEITGEVE